MLDRWRIHLSAAESTRADRYFRESDRRSYIAAHGLLRHALSRRASAVPEAAWEFAAEPAGRPVVSGPSPWTGLRFSLSHCPRMSACLVADRITAGIDVEPLDRPVSDALVARHYTPDEQRQAASLPAPERQQFLIRNWTLKEAYVKACGTGLAGGLGQVGFITNAAGETTVWLGEPPAARDEWHAESWTHAGCQVAVAIHSAGIPISLVRHVV